MHATFLDRALADRLEIFRAPVVLGASGRSAVDALARSILTKRRGFVSVATAALGPDLLESFAARV